MWLAGLRFALPLANVELTSIDWTLCTGTTLFLNDTLSSGFFSQQNS
jgi:hypothetical protein